MKEVGGVLSICEYQFIGLNPYSTAGGIAVGIFRKMVSDLLPGPWTTVVNMCCLEVIGSVEGTSIMVFSTSRNETVRTWLVFPKH